MTNPEEAEQFEQILRYLEQTRGFDFTAYKRSTLMRRVVKRMQMINISAFDEYLDYLQVHQEEFAALFNTILINVTSFFRDAEVWDTIRDEIIPVLLDAHKDNGPVRVWSAGCASGQEPYSLAMLFAEAVGTASLRDRVKIYATDADEEALAEARAATYSQRHISDVPEALAGKYFDAVNGAFVVNRDLRRAVIFGRHDLLQDAPISRVDLLLCRNTLMYFNSEAQSRIVQRLYFSLNPAGFAILGRAEMLFTHAATFTPVDLKRRVFRAVSKATGRDRLLLMAQSGREGAPATPPDARLRELAFEHESMAQLLLDGAGALSAANATARHKFHITPQDIGRPFQDLEVSYRPAEIRGALDRAIQQRGEVRVSDVPWTVSGSLRHFDVLVCPVVEESGALLGTRVSFHDITEMRALQIELQHSKQELETAYEELQSTNEELETTNEELQSTVEELETTNEELQSANEELETMNEELQSTNEELQAMNDELRTRGSELNGANAFLESVFASMASAVVVVDRDLRIKVWNDRATDLWGMRADETQQTHFLGLDIGLPLAELRQPLRDVLNGNQERAAAVVPATSRRGRAIECKVSMSPLRGSDRAPAGVILFMEEIAAEKLA